MVGYWNDKSVILFVWSGQMCEKAFQGLLKPCVSFRGSLERCNKEKMGEDTDGRAPVVKCWKML